MGRVTAALNTFFVGVRAAMRRWRRPRFAPARARRLLTAEGGARVASGRQSTLLNGSKRLRPVQVGALSVLEFTPAQLPAQLVEHVSDRTFSWRLDATPRRLLSAPGQTRCVWCGNATSHGFCMRCGFSPSTARRPLLAVTRMEGWHAIAAVACPSCPGVCVPGVEDWDVQLHCTACRRVFTVPLDPRRDPVPAAPSPRAKLQAVEGALMRYEAIVGGTGEPAALTWVAAPDGLSFTVDITWRNTQLRPRRVVFSGFADAGLLASAANAADGAFDESRAIPVSPRTVAFEPRPGGLRATVETADGLGLGRWHLAVELRSHDARPRGIVFDVHDVVAHVRRLDTRGGICVRCQAAWRSEGPLGANARGHCSACDAVYWPAHAFSYAAQRAHMDAGVPRGAPRADLTCQHCKTACVTREIAGHDAAQCPGCGGVVMTEEAAAALIARAERGVAGERELAGGGAS